MRKSKINSNINRIVFGFAIVFIVMIVYMFYLIFLAREEILDNPYNTRNYESLYEEDICRGSYEQQY